VLISEMEHHSNIVPWQLLCEERKAVLRVVPINDDGELVLKGYERLLRKRTKLVALTHVSNALGYDQSRCADHRPGARALTCRC
jgi:cysteine desulfurase/selenocysteine lyase